MKILLIDTPHMSFYTNDDGGYGIYSLTYFQPGYDAGVILHELGHAIFNWGEYYSSGNNAGTGNWGAMAHGFDVPFNPFLRSCKEWDSVYDIADFPEGTKFDIPANGYVILRYRDDDRPGEYFLIEAIEKKDRYQRAPDEGLLIWHVDEEMEWQMPDNTSGSHNRVILEQADGEFAMETDAADYGGAGDSFKAGHAEEFGGATTPSSEYYDGSSSGFEISDISEVGSRMTFVLGPKGTKATGDVVTFDSCLECDG